MVMLIDTPKYILIDKEWVLIESEIISSVPRQVMNKPVSKGLGDTIAKITHATGLDKLADIYTEITGKDCGCSKRQEFLNELAPYRSETI